MGNSLTVWAHIQIAINKIAYMTLMIEKSQYFITYL